MNQGDKDFSAILTMAKKANADIFYMSLQGFSPAAMMTHAGQTPGHGIPRSLPRTPCSSPGTWAWPRKPLKAFILTYGYTRIPARLNTKNLKNAMCPSMVKIAAYATYAYDSVPCPCSRPSRQPVPPIPAKVKAELMKLDFQGVSKHVKFKANGDSGSSYIAFKVVGDQFVPYWEPVNGLLNQINTLFILFTGSPPEAASGETALQTDVRPQLFCHDVLPHAVLSMAVI